jgi:hypothetical protein
MVDHGSKSVAIRELARELLDDIELGRLSVERTLMKALRLARLSDAIEQQTWLSFELVGYSAGNEVGAKYMGWAGRWTNQALNQAHWGPLVQLDTQIKAWEMQLQTLRIPDVNASVSLSSSNPNEYVGGSAYTRREFPDASKPINAVLTQANQLIASISQLTAIRSKTIAMIYNFVLNTHLQREFSSLTESIFDQYKLQVDTLIAASAGDVLQKVPSVWMRLAEGDPEAISHAMTSCRRIIDAFANSVHPESRLTQAMFDADKNLKRGYTTRFRINQYLASRAGSTTQKERLRRSLSDIYSKVSGGVHADVTPSEARALFLGTYLLLGEVLTMPEPPTVPVQTSNGEPPSSP